MVDWRTKYGFQVPALALALTLALATAPGCHHAGTTPATVAQTPHGRYDLTPHPESRGPILFGQRGISPRFSEEGVFHGASIDDVVARLRAGELHAADIPVHFIWVDGQRVATNNRSLAALSMAGMRPVTVIDMTGRLAATGADSQLEVLERLDEMGGHPSDHTILRASHAHDAPPRETVTVVP